MPASNLMRLPLSAAFAFALLCGCDSGSVADAAPDIPSQSQTDDARARVGYGSEGLGSLRAILELLGLIPVYSCGEPRAVFAGRIPDSLASRFAGSHIDLDASDPTLDKFTILLPAEGMAVKGQTLTGTLLLTTSGGEDRFTLDIDATQARLNGIPIRSRAGYGQCGDSSQYWGHSEGAFADKQGTYLMDTRVAKKAGMPFFGGPTFTIDAKGSYTRGGKTDALTLTSIEYEGGKALPQSGVMLIEAYNGHRVKATFSEYTPLLRQVTVKVDSYTGVTVLLPGG
jgi:hypothetical protein